MADLGPWSLVEGLGLPAAVIAMLIWVVGKYLSEQGKDLAIIKANQENINRSLVAIVARIEAVCTRLDNFFKH